MTNEDYLHLACVQEVLRTIVPADIAIDSLQITLMLDDSTVHNVFMSKAKAQCQCTKGCVLSVARQNLKMGGRRDGWVCSSYTNE